MKTRKQKLEERRALVRKWLRRVGAAVGSVVAIVFVAGFVSLVIWPPINAVETGATPQYPDIQPRDYRFSQERVYFGVREVVDETERMHLVTGDAETGVVVIEAATPSGRFIDDMHVEVAANGDGGAIVFVRSESRIGVADFGQNARNIRELFEQLEINLGLESNL